jgi:hypothetical protein
MGLAIRKLLIAVIGRRESNWLDHRFDPSAVLIRFLTARNDTNSRDVAKPIQPDSSSCFLASEDGIGRLSGSCNFCIFWIS